MLYGLPLRNPKHPQQQQQQQHHHHHPQQPQLPLSPPLPGQQTSPITSHCLPHPNKLQECLPNYPFDLHPSSIPELPEMSYDSQLFAFNPVKTTQEKAFCTGSSATLMGHSPVDSSYLSFNDNLTQTMHDPMLAAGLLTQAFACRNEQTNSRQMINKGYVMNNVIDCMMRRCESDAPHHVPFQSTPDMSYASEQNMRFPIHGDTSRLTTLDLIPKHNTNDPLTRSMELRQFNPVALPCARSATALRVNCNLGSKDRRPCDICGDISAGFHCNAYVCEACKKFFIRSSKGENFTKYTCTKAGICEINKDTRTHCQRCRYQKCLRLGMVLPGAAVFPATDISEIPCRVCGAKSSGFHFGAITCEGCKGFFRRTINEREGQRYTCRNGGNCAVTGATRNNCKSCRYRRCLAVGMSKDGSRIGRQPNAVKHRCAIEIEQLRSAVSVCNNSTTETQSPSKYFVAGQMLNAFSDDTEHSRPNCRASYEYIPNRSDLVTRYDITAAVPNVNVVCLRGNPTDFPLQRNVSSAYPQNVQSISEENTARFSLHTTTYSTVMGIADSLIPTSYAMQTNPRLMEHSSTVHGLCDQETSNYYLGSTNEFGKIDEHSNRVDSRSVSPTVVINHSLTENHARETKPDFRRFTCQYAPNDIFEDPRRQNREVPELHYPALGLIQLSEAARIHAQQDTRKISLERFDETGDRGACRIESKDMLNYLGNEKVKREHVENYTELVTELWKLNETNGTNRSVGESWSTRTLNDMKTNSVNGASVSENANKFNREFSPPNLVPAASEDGLDASQSCTQRRFLIGLYDLTSGEEAKKGNTAFTRFAYDNNNGPNSPMTRDRTDFRHSPQTDILRIQNSSISDQSELPNDRDFKKHTHSPRTGSHLLADESRNDIRSERECLNSSLSTAVHNTAAYREIYSTREHLERTSTLLVPTNSLYISPSKVFLHRFTTNACEDIPGTTKYNPNKPSSISSECSSKETDQVYGETVVSSIERTEEKRRKLSLPNLRGYAGEEQIVANRKMRLDSFSGTESSLGSSARKSANSNSNPEETELNREEMPRSGVPGDNFEIHSAYGMNYNSPSEQRRQSTTSRPHENHTDHEAHGRQTSKSVEHVNNTLAVLSSNLPSDSTLFSTSNTAFSSGPNLVKEMTENPKSNGCGRISSRSFDADDIAETVTDVICSHLASHGAMPMNLFTDRVVKAVRQLQDLQTMPFTVANASKQTIWSSMMDRFDGITHRIIQFARSVPGFREMSCTDMKSLIQESMYPITLVLLSRLTNAPDVEGKYFNYSGKDTEVILENFPQLMPVVSHLRETHAVMQSLGLTESQFALFCCILLFRGGGRSMENPNKVQTMYQHTVMALEHNQYAQGVPEGMYQNMEAAAQILTRMNAEHRSVVQRLYREMKDLQFSDLYMQMFQLADVTEMNADYSFGSSLSSSGMTDASSTVSQTLEQQTQ